MIVAIVAVSYFVDYLNLMIKNGITSQVPPQIAKSFEYLVPAFIEILIISLVGLGVNAVSGSTLMMLFLMLFKSHYYIWVVLLQIVLTFMFISFDIWSVDYMVIT